MSCCVKLVASQGTLKNSWLGMENKRAFKDLLLVWGEKLKAKSRVAEVNRYGLQSCGVLCLVQCFLNLAAHYDCLWSFLKNTWSCAPPPTPIEWDSLTEGPTCDCSWKALPGDAGDQLTSGCHQVIDASPALGRGRLPWVKDSCAGHFLEGCNVNL